MALGNLYVDGYQEILGLLQGWQPNWPAPTVVELGAVGEILTDYETGIPNFQGGNRLGDYGINFVPSTPSDPGGVRSFATGSSTKVEFGFDATTPGWEWLGDASAGFQASFGSEGGLRADADGVQQHSIDDLDSLRSSLLDAAKSGQLAKGKAIVVALDTAERGMIVASESNSGELKISTSADVKPAGVSLASFSANFDTRFTSGAAVNEALPNPFTVVYRALKVGTRGIWWWKHFVIHGAEAVTDDQIEATLDPSDYWVMY